MVRRRLAAMAALVLLTCAACGGTPEVKRYAFLDKVPAVKAVVILHPELYFRGMTSPQVYQKWMDLAAEVGSRTRLLVIGPDEYRVMVNGVLTNLAQETDLRSVLRAYGVEPEEAVAVRLSITESWQQVLRTVTKKDGTKGQRSEFDSRFAYEADVYHVGTSRPLLSLDLQHKYRGEALPTGADARPELTAFARESHARLVSLLVEHLDVGGRSDHPRLTVVPSPADAVAYAYQELNPLRIALDQKDSMERDATVDGLVGYWAPELDRGHRRTLRTAGTGLLVVSAEGCTNMQPGDFIVQAGGEPAVRPYQLVRAFHASRHLGNPLAIRFRRGNHEFQAVYECKP